MRFALILTLLALCTRAATAQAHLFPLSGQQRVAQVAWSADGGTLATLQETWVCLWDVRAGVLRAAIVAEPKELYRAIAMSPDGTTLAIGVHNRGNDPPSVQLFDARKATRKASYPRKDAPEALAFSPDGSLLACGGHPDVVLIETASGGQRATLAGSQSHGVTVHALAFYPDGKRLAVGDNGEVKVWDVAAGTAVTTLPRASVNAITALAVDRGGERLATGLKSLEVYPGSGGAALWQSEPRPDGLAFSPDGKLLATASREPALLSAADGKRLRPLARSRIPGMDDTAAYAAAFTPSGRCVATSGSWGTRLWDASSGSLLLLLYSWPPENGKVPWVAATADGWLTGSPEGRKNMRWRTPNGNMNDATPRYKPAQVTKAAKQVR